MLTWRGRSGGVRAGIIGSHPAFPGGSSAEFVGTPPRGGTARETALRTSLYFWIGECRGMREAEGPQDWCILSLELSPRVLQLLIPLLPLFLLFFRPFPSPFRACSPNHHRSLTTSSVSSVYTRIFQRQQLSNHFTKYPVQELLERFKCRL